MAETPKPAAKPAAPETRTGEGTSDKPVSTQAQFSTYSKTDPPEGVDSNPPPGQFVKQELGTPSEGPVTNPISGESGQVESQQKG